MTTLSRTIELVEDPDSGELMLDLGLDLCSALGWRPGDVIRWQSQHDGTWTLTKETEKPSAQP